MISIKLNRILVIVTFFINLLLVLDCFLFSFKKRKFFSPHYLNLIATPITPIIARAARTPLLPHFITARVAHPPLLPLSSLTSYLLSKSPLLSLTSYLLSKIELTPHYSHYSHYSHTS